MGQTVSISEEFLLCAVPMDGQTDPEEELMQNSHSAACRR